MKLRFVPPPVPAQRSVEDYAAAAEQLLALLAEERLLLQAARNERLSALSREKAALLARLCALPAHLRNPANALTAEQRTRLNELFSRCLAESQANGALLEAQAQRIRRTLAAIPAKSAQLAGYDRGGRSRFYLSAGLSGRV